MEDRRKRCSKTTRQQYMLFMEELEVNEAFRSNKFSPENPNILQETWDKLTIALNSTGGPQRSTVAWKRVFSDWKSSVKKRARLIKVSHTETGGGPPEKPLNDIEEKLIGIIGQIVIDGMKDVPELGIISDADRRPADEKQVSEEATSSSANLRKRQVEFEEDVVTPKIAKTTFRKNGTLLHSVKQMLNEKESATQDVSKILIKIDENLSKLVQFEEKKYKLEILKLKLKYLDMDICMEEHNN